MPAGPARCCSSMTCEATSVGLTTPNTPPRTVCSAPSRCRCPSKERPSGRSTPTPASRRVFDDNDVELAHEVAAWVAVAVGNAEVAARTSADLTQLRTTMMTRAFIEQAKGILIERHKINEDEAFTMLTHASQRTNTKLRDVAAELVRTGDAAQSS